jgi:hypothetical protein
MEVRSGGAGGLAFRANEIRRPVPVERAGERHPDSHDDEVSVTAMAELVATLAHGR